MLKPQTGSTGPEHPVDDQIQADYRRGTRIDERYGKLWFTILDFKKPPNCLPMSVSMAFPKKS